MKEFPNCLIKYQMKIMVDEKIKRIEKLIFNSIEEINNQLPENQLETGYNTPPATENVSSITIAGDATGTITISFTPKAGNGTIILVPTFSNQSITWQCKGGTLQSKYRPPVCR